MLNKNNRTMHYAGDAPVHHALVVKKKIYSTFNLLAGLICTMRYTRHILVFLTVKIYIYITDKFD